MTVYAVDLRPRSASEVLRLTLSLYRKHFPLFLGITALVAVPGLILASLSGLIPSLQMAIAPDAILGRTWDAGAIDASFAALSLTATCLGVLSLIFGVFWPLMDGALTQNVIERMLGRAPGLRASYAQARKSWGALWGANILAQLGIYAALFAAYVLLLIGLAFAGAFSAAEGETSTPLAAIAMSLMCLPVVLGGLVIAIVLSITWVFRAPVVMGEGAGAVQALIRSNDIARDDRWRLFGRYLLLVLIEFVVLVLPSLLVAVTVAVGALFTVGRTPGEAMRALLPFVVGGSVVSITLSFIGTLLLVPLRVIYGVVNYFDLRIRKENLAVELAQAEREAAAPAVVVPAAAPAVVAPAAAPVAVMMPAAPAPPPPPVDLAKLTPGQRVGVLYNRLRSEGESPQTLNELGLAFAALGDFGGALDALTRARALAPGDADIAYNLTQVHLSRNDTTAAREMLREYLRLETNPDDAASVRRNPRFQQLL
jgi:hypothetical protein